LNREVVQLLDCRKWLVSTNGNKFKHPDGEAIARIVKYARGKPQLLFNYMTKYNEFWGRQDVQQQHGYTAKYPKEGSHGLVVRL
jgi:hypothetical protein